MFLSLLAIHRTCKANEVEQNKHLTGSTRFICMILKFRYKSVRIVIFQTCASKSLESKYLAPIINLVYYISS